MSALYPCNRWYSGTVVVNCCCLNVPSGKDGKDQLPNQLTNLQHSLLDGPELFLS